MTSSSLFFSAWIWILQPCWFLEKNFGSLFLIYYFNDFLMIILITILFIILFLQTNPLQSKSHATLEIGRLAHPNTPWNKVCSPSTTCLVITILQYPKQENILFHTIPSNLILKVTSLTHPSCSVTNNNHDNHNNNHKLALSWSRCGYLAPATQSSSLSIQNIQKNSNKWNRKSHDR